MLICQNDIYSVLCPSGLCHIWDFVAFGIPLFVIMYVVHVTHVYVNLDYVVQYSVGV